MALPPEEQKIVARTRKTRQFLVFLRERRHAILHADWQHTLAQSSSPAPGGQAPVEPGRLARATLWQAYCHVGAREAVERTVMDKRWPLVLACRGAEQPPFSPSTLCTLRLRLSAHALAKRRRERTVALAEKPGGVGARPLRAAWDSTPLCGAGRGEDTVNLLGHALRKAVGRAAQELAASAEALLGDAGLVLVGQRRRKAALALDWGKPTAREHALRLVLAEVERWHSWLTHPQHLSVHAPPRQEGMDTIAPMVTQDTEPDPPGGSGARRLKSQVAPARRLAIEEKARRHGRTSSANTCTGFQEPCAVELESQVPRDVVVRPAHAPEPEVVEWLAAEVEKAPGLLQRDIDLGSMASPRLAPWAEQGGYISARPWPHSGPLFPKDAFPLDCVGMQGTWPGGQSVPLVRGKPVACPAAAGETCAVRAQWTKVKYGQGRSLRIREDEPCQQQRRAKIKTQRGRAALRKRTAVEPAMAHQVAHQGRRARYKGVRQNPCDGRRHAAGSNLQIAAPYEEEHQLAS